MARWIGIGFLLAVALLTPGCSGCRREPDRHKTQEEIEKELIERKKEAERLKPDFEVNSLVTRPPVGRSKIQCGVKPGHWTCLSLEDAKANHFNFGGELQLCAADHEGNALPLQATLFDLAVCRDVALAKKQVKSIESLLFVPIGGRSVSIAYQLNSGHGGRRVVEFPAMPIAGLMPSWQYHLVVLARNPHAYGYLDRLKCVRPPSSLTEDSPAAAHYRVALMGADHRAPLPAHAGQWSSIACVIWDDALPTTLDQAQQQAMLDWLHWGGQLILSGPDSLDALRNSFLAAYLPADREGAAKLDKQELAALNAFSTNAGRPLAPPRPWSGIRLKLRPQAEFVPGAGQLLAERRVGRGRIVVSAFRLTDREFTDWPGRDEVFNAMLLRRPPRKFVDDQYGEPAMQWADGGHPFDAARVTSLRYFARDAAASLPQYGGDALASDVDVSRMTSNSRQASEPPTGPGVAAWNDFNAVADAARHSLQNAARIEIPRRDFVLWVVVFYLVALVPVNWAVFRSIKRVEWAWIAAPVIAVACTIVVIRLAQLDIGFARSQTEIAVAEIQAGYPRAHVTRYNALYTSLATNYALVGDDPGAAILPLPTVSDPASFRISLGQQTRNLTCRRGDHVTLSGLHVGSNSTGMVHSEEMLDLGGEIAISETADGTSSLVNRSTLSLHGVGLLRKTPSGDLQQAWLGDLPGMGTSVPISSPVGLPIPWTTLSTTDLDTPLWPARREESPLSAQNAPADTLNLRRLLDLGQDLRSLDAGEVRLIAWSTDDLPGMSVTPAAPQTKRAILVIAHLAYGFGDPPQPDTDSQERKHPVTPLPNP
jgi:hypothetical protein